MNETEQAKSILSAITKAQADTGAAVLRQGEVQSVDGGGRISVTVGGDDTVISDVAYIGAYAPTIGDTVWMIGANQGDLVALGVNSTGAPGGSGIYTFDNYFSEVDPEGPPETPTGFTASANLGSIVISWDMVPEFLWRTWELYEGSTGGFEPGIPIKVVKTNIVTLPKDPGSGPFYYKLRVKNSRDEWSDFVEIGPYTITQITIPDGSVSITKFASGIVPPRVVNSLPVLPDAAYPAGSTVVLTTDGRLYRTTTGGAGSWVNLTDASLLTGQIGAGQIAAGAIGATEIAANAISADKIQANAITSAKIAADAITAREIAALAITANEIAANAITASKIKAGEITAAKLDVTDVQAAVVTAAVINALELDAVKITGGDIEGVSITGSVLRTADVGEARVEIDSADAQKVQMFTGDANEQLPGLLASDVDSLAGGFITLRSPQIGVGAPMSSLSLDKDSADITARKGADFVQLSVGSAAKTVKIFGLLEVTDLVKARVPSCSILRTSDGTISNNTDTNPSLTKTATVEWDTDSFFSTSTPDRITIPVAGVYLLDLSFCWAANATGWRSIGIVVGSTIVANQRIPSPGNVLCMQQVSCVRELDAGDVVKMYCRQGSGGNLTMNANAYAPRLAATWLRQAT